MAQFIHLTDERLLKRLEKSGIRTTKWGTKIRCVYATPVLKDSQVSHQWLRELKNKGIRAIGAVQFRIPDREEVLVGRYKEEPLAVTAAQAVKCSWSIPPDSVFRFSSFVGLSRRRSHAPTSRHRLLVGVITRMRTESLHSVDVITASEDLSKAEKCAKGMEHRTNPTNRSHTRRLSRLFDSA